MKKARGIRRVAATAWVIAMLMAQTWSAGPAHARVLEPSPPPAGAIPATTLIPTIVWTQNLGFEANGIAVDSSGNIYVVGKLNGVILRKYDNNGNEVWTRQFGATEYDYGNSVAVDAGGNVYVVGATLAALLGQTFAGYTDAFIRKYDANGTELWTRQFGFNEVDTGNGVVVDTGGNVYMVGAVVGALPGQTYAGDAGSYFADAFVRKYDSNGTELWTREFGTYRVDSTSGVAVDGSGNAYVVGVTEGNLVGQPVTGIPNTFIRKYEASGNGLWTRQFAPLYAFYNRRVAVDSSGNVYATDGIWGGNVRKLDTNGAEMGTIGYFNAHGVTVDGSGNIYAAGESVARYDSSGNVVWDLSTTGIVALGAKDVRVDSSGAAYVIRKETLFKVVLAPPAAVPTPPVISWSGQFTTAFNIRATDVAVDSSGNVYVAGMTDGNLEEEVAAGVSSVFLRKYDRNGTELWTRQFGTETSHYSYHPGVAVDKNGRVYLTGISRVLPGYTWDGRTHAFVRRYDGDGNEMWTRQSTLPTNDDESRIAVDDNGNIYITGFYYHDSPLVPAYVFIRKYDSEGNEIWSREISASGGDIYAWGIAVYGSSLFIAGTTQGALPDWGGQIFIRKYDGSGTEIWTRRFGMNMYDWGWDVAVDGSGNAFVVGSVESSLGAREPFEELYYQSLDKAVVRKYDSNGNEMWTREFGRGSNKARGVAVDDHNNVYVLGYGSSLTGQASAGAFIRKYDSNGNKMWTTQFGTGSTNDLQGGITFGGGIYVAGSDSNLFLPPWVPFLMKLNEVGDAAADGYINAVDITMVERMIASLSPSAPAADANQDGKVDSMDITKVERLIAKLPGEDLSIQP